MNQPVALVLTCEHAGNRVPAAYHQLFTEHEALLQTHRGYDPGALPLAQHLAKHFHIELIQRDTTRLLVEINRSLHHRALFSEISKALPKAERQQLIEQFYHPHRTKVQSAIEKHIADGRNVIHIGVHSFTPMLDGIERNVDVGLLYDPQNEHEKHFCSQWAKALKRHRPQWRIRANQPYRGKSDGLTTTLRQIFPDNYLGIELEVNQSLLSRPTEQLQSDYAAIALSIEEVLEMAKHN